MLSHEEIKNPDLFANLDNSSPREHSKKVDQAIGYKTTKIELKLLKQYCAYDEKSTSARKKHFEGSETWIGLHPQVLQTPYEEIYEFLMALKVHRPKSLVDLGAGYGRIGVVLNAIIPEAQFIGYEVLPERYIEAKRIFEHYELAQCLMKNENILNDSFELPDADVYFIYDFSDPLDLRRMLARIVGKLGKDNFFLVARGEGIRSLIQLKYPEIWVSYGVIHSGNWSIYSSFCYLN